MEPENKQRIIGLVVLIAFIALLIPFLFTSGVKKKQQLTTINNEPMPAPTSNSNSPSDKQLNSDNKQQSIVISEFPEDKPENINLENPQPQSIPITPTAPTEILPKESSTEQVTPIKSTTLQDTEVVPSKEVAQKKPAVVQPIKDTTKNKHKTLASNKIKNSTKNSSTFWSVQIGSFSDQLRMQKIVAKLQSEGFHVYLQKINTSRGLMVRVLVGRETDKAKAIKIAQQLKTKLKINGHIVGNKK